MDIEPVIDAEVVSVSRAEAERLDKRIRLLTEAVNNNLVKLYELVELAKVGEIHVVLGFPSWTAYIADVFGGQVRLDREQRRELVGYLSGEGMSTRAIAETVDVSKNTVTSDLRQVSQTGTPEAEQSDLTEAEARAITDRIRGWVDEGRRLGVDDKEMADCVAMAEFSDDEFDNVLADARRQDDLSRENVAQLCRERVAAPTPTTGLDGKTYPKPQPPQPKPRKDFTEVIDYRLTALDDQINRLEQLVKSDRFRNADLNIESICKFSDILERQGKRLDDLSYLAADVRGLVG
jgi:hypothetical protein